MTRIEKKKGGVSSLVLRLGLVALAAYLVVGMVFNQVEIAAKRQQLEAVQQQLEAQQAQNDELSRVLQSAPTKRLWSGLRGISWATQSPTSGSLWI